MSLSARPWNELLSLFVFISVIFMKFACASRLYKWHRMNFHMQPFLVFVRGGCMHMHMGLYLYKAPHIQFISNIVLYMKWSMKPHAGSAPDRNTRSWCGHCICRRKRKMYGLCTRLFTSEMILPKHLFIWVRCAALGAGCLPAAETLRLSDLNQDCGRCSYSSKGKVALISNKKSLSSIHCGLI